MIKQISIKTKIGWISAFEEKDKIIRVKFGKCKNISNSKNLKKFEISINNFFLKKNKIWSNKILWRDSKKIQIISEICWENM